MIYAAYLALLTLAYSGTGCPADVYLLLPKRAS